MEVIISDQFLYNSSFFVFLLLILLFMILSAVLNYHWIHYEIASKNMKKIKMLYFGVSLVLIFIMAATLIFSFYKS